MGRDLNCVIIVGRLVSEPEFKTTANSELLKFSIASNCDRSKDQPEVNFFDVLAWGKTASGLQTWLKKGMQVAIQGSLHQSRWEQEDGKKRSRIEIVAHVVQVLTSKKQQERELTEKPAAMTADDRGPDSEQIPF